MCKNVVISDILSILVFRIILRSTKEGPKQELLIPYEIKCKNIIEMWHGHMVTCHREVLTKDVLIKQNMRA